MESGSTATQKHKNPHKKLKETETEDIFSKLPEPLISRILSFLTTEDAVCTSVLSKRWINRWTFITRLYLDDSVLYRERILGSKVHFVNFVNRALLLTQGSSMESFSLVIFCQYDASLLSTWISSILIRRVKKLCICMTSAFPSSPLTSHLLFNSQYYLEELVVQVRYSSIKVPPCGFVGFSSLKLLKLHGTIFTFESSLDLNFRNLKKFETKDCFWVSECGGSVTIDAPLLETILIKHHFETESSDPSSCAINFSATQLKEITYYGAGGDASLPIILSAPLSACNASAEIFLFWYEQDGVPETESRAFLLLKQFNQVKSLTFYGLEVLTQPNLTALPVFAMLCRLDLDSITCEILLGLLHKSPVLKTLILKGISKFEQELLNSCVVPECLTSTLQIVKFEDVNGCDQELYLAKFFLENGTVLERMSFSPTYRPYKPKVVTEEFKEKLFSFKKNFSSFAIVEFS